MEPPKDNRWWEGGIAQAKIKAIFDEKIRKFSVDAMMDSSSNTPRIFLTKAGAQEPACWHEHDEPAIQFFSEDYDRSLQSGS